MGRILETVVRLDGMGRSDTARVASEPFSLSFQFLTSSSSLQDVKRITIEADKFSED